MNAHSNIAMTPEAKRFGSQEIADAIKARSEHIRSLTDPVAREARKAERETRRAGRAAQFAKIVEIASYIKPTSSQGLMDQAQLALCYLLGSDFVSGDMQSHLEGECGVDHEFGHEYCARRDALKRDWFVP